MNYEMRGMGVTLGISKEIIPVRSRVKLNLSILEQFLRSTIANLPNDVLKIKQCSSGYPNLTEHINTVAWEAILKKSLRRVTPEAHDRIREYNILSELYPRFKQAPKPILFSEGKMT